MLLGSLGNFKDYFLFSFKNQLDDKWMMNVQRCILNLILSSVISDENSKINNDGRGKEKENNTHEIIMPIK